MPVFESLMQNPFLQGAQDMQNLRKSRLTNETLLEALKTSQQNRKFKEEDRGIDLERKRAEIAGINANTRATTVNADAQEMENFVTKELGTDFLAENKRLDQQMKKFQTFANEGAMIEKSAAMVKGMPGPMATDILTRNFKSVGLEKSPILQQALSSADPSAYLGNVSKNMQLQATPHQQELNKMMEGHKYKVDLLKREYALREALEKYKADNKVEKPDKGNIENLIYRYERAYDQAIIAGNQREAEYYLKKVQDWTKILGNKSDTTSYDITRAKQGMGVSKKSITSGTSYEEPKKIVPREQAIPRIKKQHPDWTDEQIDDFYNRYAGQQ